MIPRLSLSEKIPQVVQNFLGELRQSIFSGKINHDYATRIVTSTDNSIYQVLPQAIISPKNISDIQTVMSIAEKKTVSQKNKNHSSWWGNRHKRTVTVRRNCS